MEKQTTRHNKSKEQTRLASSSSSRSPTTVNDIPDQLLKLIFRRLDSHVAYVRAAAVCSRWRRIVSTRGINNVECNHHDFSTTIGYYYVADPSPSPPGQPQPHRRVAFVPASPSIDARHFTLDFLPTTSSPGNRHQRRWDWDVVDGCGSLLLLAVANQRRRRGMFFPDDLVVCEPISRRYVKIDPTDDMKHRHRHCLGVFLNRYRYVPSMCSFSLTCVLCEPSMGIADGVSAVTARVYRHQPPGWNGRWWEHGWSMPRLASSGSGSIVHLRGAAAESARYAGRSKGFRFLGIQEDDGGGAGTVGVAAREGSGVLSRFRLPVHVVGGGGTSTFRFVDDDGAGDNDDNLVRVVSLVGEELRVFVKREQELGNAGCGGSDWVAVQSLNLREATRGLPGFKECFFGITARIVTAGKGYVVLTPAEETWLFSVELGTMEVERDHIRNRLAGEVYPYELRLRPRVRACLLSCKRGRWGPCYDICKCK